MQRLTQLSVEGFKRIEFLEMPIQGVTEISGPNGAGKSSALDAIAVLFDGLKCAPDEPINKGATRSKIRGRLGEMHVTRYIDAKKGGGHTTKLVFEPVDGKPYPATQKQLDDLIGEHMLDPLDFLALDSKDMFKALQAFVPGFDFVAGAQADAGDYARRTEVNRAALQARAAGDLIIVPSDTPAEAIDEQKLVQELQEAGEKNTDRENRRARRERCSADIERLRAEADPERIATKVAEERTKLESECNRRISDLQTQIDTLTRQQNTLAVECSTAVNAVTKSGSDYADSCSKQADDLQLKLNEAGELPPVIDTAALAEAIIAAKATNANIARAAEKRRHATTAKRYEDEGTQLTEAMNARRTAREEAIANSKMPIAGIEFGDGEIRLNGVPLDQASTAERLRMAVGYVVSRNPKLRLAWIRDGSLLDDNSYAEVGRLAAEFQCDILIETVRPIGNNAIVMERGKVKGAAPRAEEAAGHAA